MTTNNPQHDVEGAAASRPASLWRNRDYLLLWGGQTFSSLGTSISQLAFPLLILMLTSSPEQAGFAGALRTLPYFILCLPAGALIDRWDRKRVILICDSGRALSLASIPIAALHLGHLTILQLYLNALIEGTLVVFFSLAESSCISRVVPREQLPAATAQGSFTEGLVQLLGPPLAGVLYGLGRTIPFIVDAASYCVSIMSLLLIKRDFQEERVEKPLNLRAEIGEGLRWLWGQPTIRSLALLTGIVNFIFPDSSALIVIVIARQQHTSPAFIGVIFAVGAVGYLVGALVCSLCQRRFSVGRIIVSTCWLFTLFWPLYALASNLFVLAGVTALIALVDPIYDITQFSYRAARIPDALQGRVHSAYRLIALATPPLGLALTGVLLQRFGTTPTILVFAVALLGLALLATLNRSVRRA
ncbi:MAG: MFS transporter [Chloroflexota bacterium]|nr:MFS transporter [Chloroflexota bacterium]